MLIALWSGGRGTDDRRFYVYFNTRTKSFEETDYLRAVNGLIAHREAPDPGESPSEVLCGEPIGGLPSATELAHRLEALDSELNAIYQAQLNKNEQDRDYLRKTELNWIDARDEGLKFYLKHVPESERERRRLQFLGDATAQQILVLTPPDSEE